MDTATQNDDVDPAPAPKRAKTKKTRKVKPLPEAPASITMADKAHIVMEDYIDGSDTYKIAVAVKSIVDGEPDHQLSTSNMIN